MKTTTSSKGNIVAIITMMFLFAMISFVTNLAAPVGVIWKNTFAGGENANTIGMLGNAMNFLAYLFMGIPSGKMLAKIGYKNTAMTGVATGIAGLVLQFLSGTCSSAELGFSIYLLGAFVCGFSVCMLNTVVNPMINLLGGGGNRGNQLNLIGGTLNSLSGTLTPMLVGSLIGEVTKDTKIANVNVVLFIAMAVFAAAFCILYFIKTTIRNTNRKRNWHTRLGISQTSSLERLPFSCMSDWKWESPEPCSSISLTLQLPVAAPDLPRLQPWLALWLPHTGS